MRKSWIDKTKRRKLYESHLIIIFLPHKELDEEEEGSQTTIMVDFDNVRNLKIISFIILKEEEKDMTIIIQLLTNQRWWPNQRLNASSVTSMDITNLNVTLIWIRMVVKKIYFCREGKWNIVIDGLSYE